MNYQNVLCLGDSQTFGARTYGCYPIHLARSLAQATPYTWRVINKSVNGFTARDLWFKVNDELALVDDTYQACLLIGTNDVGRDSDPELFAAYYDQILVALAVHGMQVVHCGEIPPIHPDGHVFFDRDAVARRDRFNKRLQDVVDAHPIASPVTFGNMPRDLYEDPVHFNERGNEHVAAAFCDAITAR